MSARRISLFVLSLATLVVAGASLAWACSQQAVLESVSPSSGAPGTQVTVTGSAFFRTQSTSTASKTVEIHWNWAGGPLLATAEGPSFSERITIPYAPPGTYLIVAVLPPDDGDAGGRASAAFTVPAAGGGPVGGGGANSGGGENSGITDSGGENSGITDGGDETAAQPQPLGGRQDRDSARGRDGPASTPDRPAPVGASAPGSRPRAGGPGSADPATTTADGRTVFEGSLGPAATESSVGGERRSSPSGGPATTPSERSVGGDVWSGFRSAGGQSLLGTGDAPVPAGGGPASMLGVSVGLIALGLFALLAGLFVARRRRRAAGAHA